MRPHTKRRENRDWKSPPSYRGEVWFHAAQKSEPNLLALENVEALPMPIPWKGAQGLAEVDPFGVELVRIIASCGHRLDLAAVPATAAKEMVPIIASGVPDVTLDSVVAKLIEEGQLKQDGQVLFTRSYKLAGDGGAAPPKRGKRRGAEQQSFGW